MYVSVMFVVGSSRESLGGVGVGCARLSAWPVVGRDLDGSFSF